MADSIYTSAYAVLLFATVVALIAVILFVVTKWRGHAEDDQPKASELLTKFRELHAKGALSDDEFRTIKTKLSAQLQQELRDSEETG